MYSFHVKMNQPFAKVVSLVVEELKTEGFGVLTEIDVKATLKKKLDVDRLPYLILGACNPQLANRAINAEPDVGLLLPCNVVVSEEEDGSMLVRFMDPLAVLGLVDNPQMKEIAQDALARLQGVARRLKENTP